MPVIAPQAGLCLVQNVLKAFTVQLPIWQWSLSACLILETVSDEYLLYICYDAASLVEKPSSSRKCCRQGAWSRQTCRAEAIRTVYSFSMGDNGTIGKKE